MTRAAEAAEARRLAAESDAAVRRETTAEINFGELSGALEETTLFVLPRSIQRVASSDRLSSGTTMMVTYFMSNVRWIEPW